jgi:hypothetical protein
LGDSPLEKDSSDEPEKPKEAKVFVKPTVDEVRAYCAERKNGVDPEAWWDHYESNGWKVGRTPMKDWKAAVRTWERKRKEWVETRVGENKETISESSFETDTFFAAAMERTYGKSMK